MKAGIRDEALEKRIGARVRYYRQKKGMTQTELGKSVDLTFQQIQKYEKGANRVSISRLIQFSETLQFDLSGFFEGIVDEQVDGIDNMDDVLLLLSDRRAMALLRSFASLEEGPVKTEIFGLVTAISKDRAS